MVATFHQGATTYSAKVSGTVVHTLEPISSFGKEVEGEEEGEGEVGWWTRVPTASWPTV